MKGVAGERKPQTRPNAFGLLDNGFKIQSLFMSNTTENTNLPDDNILSYLSSSTGQWNDVSGENETQVKQELQSELLSALQMYNLIVLTGSGTSIPAGGPSMTKLWDDCITNEKTRIEQSERLKFCRDKAETNIEQFLSLCEASIECESDQAKKDEISDFVKECRNIIRSLCHEFLRVDKANGFN